MNSIERKQQLSEQVKHIGHKTFDRAMGTPIAPIVYEGWGIGHRVFGTLHEGVHDTAVAVNRAAKENSIVSKAWENIRKKNVQEVDVFPVQNTGETVGVSEQSAAD